MTDEEWAFLEPLIEACRTPCTVPIRNLRQRIDGIVWRRGMRMGRNGAPCRPNTVRATQWCKSLLVGFETAPAFNLLIGA
jgi:hypothetical protein